MNTRWLLLGVGVVLTVGTAALADDWPQWRGPDRTDVSKEKGLLKEWPKGGPKLLWKTDKVGIGFSGPAIVGDVLYTMGAWGAKDTGGELEFAMALDVTKDGKQIWTTKVGPIFTFKDNVWGDGPRATPTVDSDRVYCLGGQGELLCIQRDKGTILWRKSMIKDFHGQVMEYIPPRNWGYCESPLIDNEKLICCPGGPDGNMIALDKMTGNLLWRTKDWTDQASDSSTVVAVIGGVRQYIQTSYSTKEGAALAGVSAQDGKLLWRVLLDNVETYAICPTPIVKGDLVYTASGYGTGCNLFQIEKSGAGEFTATEKYASRAKKVMTNDHGGVLELNGYCYGYSDLYGWVCQEFATGTEKWREKRVLDGKGSLTCADGRLYLLSDRGVAVLLEPNPKAWEERGRFTLPALSKTHETRDSHNQAGVWTHPVVANGRLYLRDQELLYCYAVK